MSIYTYVSGFCQTAGKSVVLSFRADSGEGTAWASRFTEPWDRPFPSAIRNQSKLPSLCFFWYFITAKEKSRILPPDTTLPPEQNAPSGWCSQTQKQKGSQQSEQPLHSLKAVTRHHSNKLGSFPLYTILPWNLTDWTFKKNPCPHCPTQAPTAQVQVTVSLFCNEWPDFCFCHFQHGVFHSECFSAFQSLRTKLKLLNLQFIHLPMLTPPGLFP